MQESFHPAGYNYASRYRNLYCYRRFEGGAVYLGQGVNDWVVITDEGTMLDLLSEEDAVGLAERAVHICSFSTATERNQFVATRFSLRAR